MNLAQQLREISSTKQADKICGFRIQIQEHPEKKLLMTCLDAARYGKTKISFGRNALPPKSLKEEGFHLEPDGAGFVYCWD